MDFFRLVLLLFCFWWIYYKLLNCGYGLNLIFFGGFVVVNIIFCIRMKFNGTFRRLVIFVGEFNLLSALKARHLPKFWCPLYYSHLFRISKNSENSLTSKSFVDFIIWLSRSHLGIWTIVLPFVSLSEVPEVF